MHPVKQLASLIIAGLASPLLAGAQVQATPSAAGCPVMVTAKYIPGAALRPVNPATNGPSRQPLHLSFGTTAQMSFGSVLQGVPLDVREVQVRVRGITEKGGVIPVETTAFPSPWLEKTFTVNVNRNSAGVLTSTIWLTGYGAVSGVRIDTMTFADGKTWKADAQQSCHVSTGTLQTS
jgi:hypothetical protein